MKSHIKIMGIMMFVLILSACIHYDFETLEINLNEGVDTVELGGVFIDCGAYAIINGRVTQNVNVISNNVDTNQIGTYQIIYEVAYRDVKKQAVRYVVVIDQQAPKIVINPGIDTVFKGDTWIDAGVHVTDNANLEIEVRVTGSVITAINGEYVITYTARDAYGNTSVAYRYVYVVNRPLSTWVNE